MLNEPKISLIIPVYNVENFIDECLQSCVGQSFKDIEIICVDDCGTDKSMQRVQEFAKNDSRIQVIKHDTNQGLLMARISGVSKARGEYIMFVDSDDFLDEKACEIAYNASGGGHYDIVSFGIVKINDEARQEILIHYDENETYERAEFFQKLIKTRYPVWYLCARLIKTEIYQKTLPFFQNSARGGGITSTEDGLQLFFLYNLAKNFHFIDKELYFYRFNPDSSTNSKSIVRQQKKIQSITKVASIIKEALLHYPFLDKKLAKIWLNSLIFLKKRAIRQLKKDQGTLTLKDKLSFFFCRIIFVIKCKIRMKFGIVL